MSNDIERSKIVGVESNDSDVTLTLRSGARITIIPGMNGADTIVIRVLNCWNKALKLTAIGTIEAHLKLINECFD
jgi:hypothetical protein